jgi:zinc protease
VPIEGGEAAITAALEASRQVPVTAPVVAAAMEWPYTSFGTPTQPSGQTEIADLGTTLITFPNGVKLTVKPTTFTDEQILVTVRAGNGQLGLPTDRPVPTYASSAYSEGGLGKLTRSQLEQVLAGDVVGASFGVGGDTYSLGGTTRPEDFDLQMQLLAAYFTDPAWRPEPFALVKSSLPTQLDQVRATPGGAFALASAGLLSSGDRRFGLPSNEEIAAGAAFAVVLVARMRSAAGAVLAVGCAPACARGVAQGRVGGRRRQHAVASCRQQAVPTLSHTHTP